MTRTLALLALLASDCNAQDSLTTQLRLDEREIVIDPRFCTLTRAPIPTLAVGPSRIGIAIGAGTGPGWIVAGQGGADITLHAISCLDRLLVNGFEVSA